MKHDLFVVGLAASGSGIGSLEQFFSQLVAPANTAFVVVTHQQRDRESNLASIIQQNTFMPVHKVVATTAIQPGNVYVLTENTYLYIDWEYLKVIPRSADARNEAIDYFFMSLGRQCGKQAIAIVLWGMGTDGVQGLMEVERLGGLVIVQTPNAQSESDMARAAIELDHPHMVLEVSQMGGALEKHVADNREQGAFAGSR